MGQLERLGMNGKFYKQKFTHRLPDGTKSSPYLIDEIMPTAYDELTSDEQADLETFIAAGHVVEVDKEGKPIQPIPVRPIGESRG